MLLNTRNILLTVSLMVWCFGSGQSMSDEKRLNKHLLEGYERVGRVGRPVFSANQSVNVEFGISLIQADIDENLHFLNSKLWLKYKWRDPLLQWNPEQFAGVDTVRAPISQIWMPDIKHYNSYDVSMQVDDSTLAVVYSNGTVLWIPPVRTRSRCSRQGSEWQCRLKFCSWTYNGLKLDLNFYGNHEDIDDSYFDPDQWRLTEHGAQKNIVYYPCCSEPYPDITFNMAFAHITCEEQKLH